MLVCNSTLLSIIVGKSGQELQTASHIIDSQEQRKKRMHAHLLACLHSAQLLHSYIVFYLLPRE